MFEAAILEKLAIKRSIKLRNIATDLMLKGWPKEPVASKYLAALEHESLVDDIELESFFKGCRPQVKELHLKRCEESCIPQCTCIIKGTGESEVL